MEFNAMVYALLCVSCVLGAVSFFLFRQCQEMAAEQEDFEYQRDLQIRTINQLRESNETLTTEAEKRAKTVVQTLDEKREMENFAQDCVQRMKLAMKDLEKKNATANATIVELQGELKRLKQLPSIFLPNAVNAVNAVMEEIDSLEASSAPNAASEAPVLLRTRG
ncbi:MAG: hypothetical protein LBC93_05020 [Synergistaceae bacterium]|jgi:chromosome segregation ATPase|nr:hypothetical protein [Synergistaceae bacterium]